MYKPTNELKIETDIDENKITETSSQKNTKKSIKKKIELQPLNYKITTTSTPYIDNSLFSQTHYKHIVLNE